MKVVRSVSLDYDVVKKLDDVARKRGIKFSILVNMILKQYITEIFSKENKDEKGENSGESILDIENPYKVKIVPVKKKVVVRIPEEFYINDYVYAVRCEICGQQLLGKAHSRLPEVVKNHYRDIHGVEAVIHVEGGVNERAG